MEAFWRIFYNFFTLPLLYLFFRFKALFDEKVSKSLKDRKGVFENLKTQLASAKAKSQTKTKPYTIWFHCSSWEFEQAKTLISALKDQARIVVSFFSPSGFESAKNYPYIDATFYLPFDTPKNAKKLIVMLCPSLLIFVKFDIWPNLVWQAKKSGVPVAIVAGSLHAKSKRIWPIARSFFKSVHKHISLHGAISELDAKRFERLASKNSRIFVSGDTRYDQVYQRASSFQADEILIPGQQNLQSKSIVAGSTHLEDEKILLDAYRRLLDSGIGLKLILVPHETTQKRISEAQALLSKFNLSHLCLSELSEVSSADDLEPIEVILVDRIGILAKLYQLGFLAFVGGSFYGSVHNVMEAAALSKPVIFGPHIHNSYEALQLVQIGAGMVVNDADEMASLIRKLRNEPQLCNKMGALGRDLIEKNLGATERTLSHLKRILMAK